MVPFLGKGAWGPWRTIQLGEDQIVIGELAQPQRYAFLKPLTPKFAQRLYGDVASK